MKGLVGLAALAASSVAAASGASSGSMQAAAQMAAAQEAARVAACADMAASPWPRSATARRALLLRLEASRDRCVDQPAFLAALGGAWLDDGEPAQALLWLERALLLDPRQLGAQADHALALAALGETAALDELVLSWQRRTDVPPPLRERLLAGVARAQQARQARPNGTRTWAFYREAAVLAGYETNLDRSPRLSEITLTPPDGPLQAPLATPIEPRRGAAVSADLSWQVARGLDGGGALQTGIQVGTRRAPGASETDWHHVQWAAGGAQQWGAWRGRAQASATWIGGRLNEPYRLGRVSLSVDRAFEGCSLRVQLDAEDRDQRRTRALGGTTSGVLLNTQCTWPRLRGWTVGMAVRGSEDQPVEPGERPGGTQRNWSMGLRVQGTLGLDVRMDTTLRFSQARDDEGYSPLLENNARRRLGHAQVGVEFARPIRIGEQAAEALLQLQAVRQTSNLVLFRYSGVSTYAGLRWVW